MSKSAAVIGGGPAGLMAAHMLAEAGIHVTIFEAKPSLARKFLMAGKSGLNLTKDESLETLLKAYHPHSEILRPMLSAFDAPSVQNWARDLGQELFTGTTGRVFPKAMKASPLLRAWMGTLDSLGVKRKTRWRLTDFGPEELTFTTPEGPRRLNADATVLAMGGASWSRLGSDGAWAEYFTHNAIPLTPFDPRNTGIRLNWSPHMHKHFGKAIKGVAWSAGPQKSRGEAVISKTGLEGGGIYPLSAALTKGATLALDLCPDLSLKTLQNRLEKPQGKNSLSNHLRKTLGLSGIKIALLQECARPLPRDPDPLSRVIKNLTLPYTGLNPLDEAISTSGGVSWAALDQNLMLRNFSGIFCAGEMLDWSAPTGGYLLTGCLATGRWAGLKAAQYLKRDKNTNAHGV